MADPTREATGAVGPSSFRSALPSPATRLWANWARQHGGRLQGPTDQAQPHRRLKMIVAGEHTSDKPGVRFLSEAATAAKLPHPNLVQIFHIAEHAGHPFFEMEFVGGGSLADGLDGMPRSPCAVGKLVECLARATGEAHRLGKDFLVRRGRRDRAILASVPACGGRF